MSDEAARHHDAWLSEVTALASKSRASPLLALRRYAAAVSTPAASTHGNSDDKDNCDFFLRDHFYVADFVLRCNAYALRECRKNSGSGCRTSVEGVRDFFYVALDGLLPRLLSCAQRRWGRHSHHPPNSRQGQQDKATFEEEARSEASSTSSTSECFFTPSAMESALYRGDLRLLEDDLHQLFSLRSSSEWGSPENGEGVGAAAVPVVTNTDTTDGSVLLQSSKGEARRLSSHDAEERTTDEVSQDEEEHQARTLLALTLSNWSCVELRYRRTARAKLLQRCSTLACPQVHMQLCESDRCEGACTQQGQGPKSEAHEGKSEAQTNPPLLPSREMTFDVHGGSFPPFETPAEANLLQHAQLRRWNGWGPMASVEGSELALDMAATTATTATAATELNMAAQLVMHGDLAGSIACTVQAGALLSSSLAPSTTSTTMDTRHLLYALSLYAAGVTVEYDAQTCESARRYYVAAVSVLRQLQLALTHKQQHGDAVSLMAHTDTKESPPDALRSLSPSHEEASFRARVLQQARTASVLVTDSLDRLDAFLSAFAHDMGKNEIVTSSTEDGAPARDKKAKHNVSFQTTAAAPSTMRGPDRATVKESAGTVRAGVTPSSHASKGNLSSSSAHGKKGAAAKSDKTLPPQCSPVVTPPSISIPAMGNDVWRVMRRFGLPVAVFEVITVAEALEQFSPARSRPSGCVSPLTAFDGCSEDDGSSHQRCVPESSKHPDAAHLKGGSKDDMFSVEDTGVLAVVVCAETPLQWACETAAMHDTSMPESLRLPLLHSSLPRSVWSLPHSLETSFQARKSQLSEPSPSSNDRHVDGAACHGASFTGKASATAAWAVFAGPDEKTTRIRLARYLRWDRLQNTGEAPDEVTAPGDDDADDEEWELQDTADAADCWTAELMGASAHARHPPFGIGAGAEPLTSLSLGPAPQTLRKLPASTSRCFRYDNGVPSAGLVARKQSQSHTASGRSKEAATRMASVIGGTSLSNAALIGNFANGTGSAISVASASSRLRSSAASMNAVKLLSTRLGTLLKAEKAFETRWVATERVKSALLAYYVPQQLMRLKAVLLQRQQEQIARQDASARVLVRFFRDRVLRERPRLQGFLPRDERRAKAEADATLTFQRYTRRWLAIQRRKQLEGARDAYVAQVARVQALFRRRQAMQLVVALREEKAAKDAAKVAVERRHFAALQIQRAYRGHVERLRFWRATNQQKRARRCHLRDSRNDAATQIQKMARGMLVRREWGSSVQACRQHARNVFRSQLLKACCVTIQRYYRGYRVRRQLWELAYAQELERRRQRNTGYFFKRYLQASSAAAAMTSTTTVLPAVPSLRFIAAATYPAGGTKCQDASIVAARKRYGPSSLYASVAASAVLTRAAAGVAAAAPANSDADGGSEEAQQLRAARRIQSLYRQHLARREVQRREHTRTVMTAARRAETYRPFNIDDCVF